MIGLMDCNNFFVSCERLFRPDLLRKPVIVLSSNDGCVVSRSQEVKDLGISMGVPYFEIKGLCKEHSIAVFSSNFSLYRDISARVMNALKSEFDQYEIYSVDEAFFEINELNDEAIACVRARIIQKTGIPVSIGIAKTKTLAKVANRIAKTRTRNVSHPVSESEGMCILDDKLWQEVRENLTCGAVWGVGRQTATLLSKHGIHTVSDLLNQDTVFLRHLLGVFGERLVLELGGIPFYKIGDLKQELHKSYMSTGSFAKPIYEKSILKNAIASHVSKLAIKLRNAHNSTSRMTIIMRGSRFGSYTLREGSKSVDLTIPTNDTFTLIGEAMKIVDILFDAEIPYKKAGVLLSNIEPLDQSTLALFSLEQKVEKYTKLNTVMDTLSRRFGSGIISSGAQLGSTEWKTSTKLISKEYTTKWRDIPVVKAD